MNLEQSVNGRKKASCKRHWMPDGRIWRFYFKGNWESMNIVGVGVTWQNGKTNQWEKLSLTVYLVLEACTKSTLLPLSWYPVNFRSFVKLRLFLLQSLALCIYCQGCWPNLLNHLPIHLDSVQNGSFDFSGLNIMMEFLIWNSNW